MIPCWLERPIGAWACYNFDTRISIFFLVFFLKADPLLWLEKSLAAHVGKQSVGLSADAKLDNKPLSHHQPRPSSDSSRSWICQGFWGRSRCTCCSGALGQVVRRCPKRSPFDGMHPDPNTIECSVHPERERSLRLVDTDICCAVIGWFAGCPVSAGRALGKGGVQWREERKSRCESTRFGKTTTLKNQLGSVFGPLGE